MTREAKKKKEKEKKGKQKNGEERVSRTELAKGSSNRNKKKGHIVHLEGKEKK